MERDAKRKAARRAAESEEVVQPDEVEPDSDLDRNGFHVQRLYIVMISPIGMLGTFLPWLHTSSGESRNGTFGPGWVTFGLYAAAIVLSLRGPLHDATRWSRVAAITGLLASALGILSMRVFRNLAAQEAASNPLLGGSMSFGIGLYLVTFAGVALFVVAAVSNWKYHRPRGILL